MSPIYAAFITQRPSNGTRAVNVHIKRVRSPCCPVAEIPPVTQEWQWSHHPVRSMPAEPKPAMSPTRPRVSGKARHRSGQ